MAKLKNREQGKLAIRKNERKEEKEEKTPSISLKYLTKDTAYRVERFEIQPKDRLLILDGLYKMMDQLGNMTWTSWIMRSKKQGGPEKIPRKNIRSSIIPPYAEQQAFFLSAYFGNADKYRMIGFREDDVFYIIGFDLDFSAYDHGS